MADEFKVGDVVFLKSGSHPMTISGMLESGKVARVIFFNDSKELRSIELRIETITHNAKKAG